MVPWFEPTAWGWLPGAALGILGGVVGTLIGLLAPRGKARALVLGVTALAVLLSAAALAAGAVARLAGQPFGIWYGFALPGMLGLLVFSICLALARRAAATHPGEAK